MRSTLIVTLSMLAGSMFAAASQAAPVSVDGVLGAEWSGASVAHVLYNPSAPISNFGAPTNENAYGAYDIYTRGDAGYLYVGLTTVSDYVGGLDFANLYFSTNAPITGSNIGFETGNFDAFVPGVPGSYPYTTAGSDIHYALTPGVVGTSPSVIEFAVPWSVFTSNSLSIPGLVPATSHVRLNLSQSFGYSVAGGQSFYGDARLGDVTVPVPEPTSMALVALTSVAGLVTGRRRR